MGFNERLRVVFRKKVESTEQIPQPVAPQKEGMTRREVLVKGTVFAAGAAAGATAGLEWKKILESPDSYFEGNPDDYNEVNFNTAVPVTVAFGGVIFDAGTGGSINLRSAGFMNLVEYNRIKQLEAADTGFDPQCEHCKIDYLLTRLFSQLNSEGDDETRDALIATFETHLNQTFDDVNPREVNKKILEALRELVEANPEAAFTIGESFGITEPSDEQKAGHHTQHIADEEFHENVIGAGVSAGLAVISDISTNAIQYEVNRVVEMTDEMEKKDVADNPKRPEINASVQEWEAYEKEVSKDLADQVTRSIAITGIVAPFATTYMSSSIGNQMKVGAAGLLFEQSVAKKVIEKKKEGSPTLSIDDIENNSQHRSNELLKKLTDLKTALSANIQGGVLLGDPPQIFAFIDQHKNIPRILLGEAYGLVNSVSMTIALTASWCRDAGIEDANVKSKLVAHVQEVVKQYGGLKPAPDAPVKPSGADIAEAITGIDVDSTDPTKKSQLAAAARYRYRAQSSFGKYMETKLHILAAMPDSVMEKISRLVEKQSDTSLTQEEKLAKMTDLLTKGKIDIDETSTEENSGVFDAINDIVNTVAADMGTALERENEQGTTEQADPEIGAVIQEQMATSDAEMKKGKNIREMLLRLGFTDDNINELTPEQQREEITIALKEAAEKDPEAVAALARELGVENSDEKQPEKTEHSSHGEKLFGHTGTEVRDTLWTQLPAAGPAAVVAEGVISSTFDLKGGAERSSIVKVTGAVSAGLASEAFLSSIADNVAAYKYAYKLMCKMVQRVYGDAVQKKYGKSVIDAFPHLHDAIYAVSLKIAEAAGAMTKYGNGPNFSQQEMVIMTTTEYEAYHATLNDDAKSKTSTSPINANRVLVRRQLEWEPWKNKYANIANAALLTTSIGWITANLVSIEADLGPAEPATA